jgi:hypothetical protein
LPDRHIIVRGAIMQAQQSARGAKAVSFRGTCTQAGLPGALARYFPVLHG